MKKIFMNKSLWLVVYLLTAVLAWRTDIVWPIRMFVIIGIVCAVVLWENSSKDDAESYRWIAVHLLGVVFAAMTGDINWI